jgi:hypothetical protein
VYAVGCRLKSYTVTKAYIQKLQCSIGVFFILARLSDSAFGLSHALCFEKIMRVCDGLVTLFILTRLWESAWWIESARSFLIFTVLAVIYEYYLFLTDWEVSLYFTEPSLNCSPITVAARSKAWAVFARSNTGIVGSNPTQGMDVCVRLFCVCVLCIGSGLATGWSPVQGAIPSVYRIKKLKKRPRSTRAVEP